MIPTKIDFEDLDFITLAIDEADLKIYRRLDHFLNSKIPSLSRTLIKKLFEAGEISWDEHSPPPLLNQKLSLSKMPLAKSVITINIPPPIPSGLTPENIPLEILYEDEYLLLVNKPAGMVTHPAPGNYSGTLVNAILYHCPDLKGIGGVERPGIVHRLDKGTSGVMVVAKTQKCHEGLVELFAHHHITRHYEALIVGNNLPLTKKLEATIGRHPQHRQKMAANPPRGKKAITYFKMIHYYPQAKIGHCQLTLETGRTHQIRVHLSSLLLSPILMDPLYGKPNEQGKKIPEIYHPYFINYSYPFLHAKTLGFIHPITQQELLFTVPPPEPFRHLLQILSGN